MPRRYKSRKLGKRSLMRRTGVKRGRTSKGTVKKIERIANRVMLRKKETIIVTQKVNKIFTPDTGIVASGFTSLCFQPECNMVQAPSVKNYIEQSIPLQAFVGSSTDWGAGFPAQLIVTGERIKRMGGYLNLLFDVVFKYKSGTTYTVADYVPCGGGFIKSTHNENPTPQVETVTGNSLDERVDLNCWLRIVRAPPTVKDEQMLDYVKNNDGIMDSWNTKYVKQLYCKKFVMSNDSKNGRTKFMKIPLKRIMKGYFKSPQKDDGEQFQTAENKSWYVIMRAAHIRANQVVWEDAHWAVRVNLYMRRYYKDE